MLMLLFTLDGSRYAIEAQRVVEVVPLVELEQIPQAPAWVAGLFDYRGNCVPVVDLCQLTCGRPARTSFTTRIIAADYVLADGRHKVLGLLAEQVTETARLEDDRFQPTELHIENAPYLGAAARYRNSLVQRIDIDRLLPDTVRQQLFPAEAI